MKTTIACAAFILLFKLNSSAQKLPNKQEISLRAPSAIKIDGTLKEWTGNLKAYNTAVNLFYTISNNDDKLYLTIKATDPGIANKIAAGGITLTIIASGNKKDKNGMAITFPAKKTKNAPYFLGYKDIQELTSDTVKNRVQIDSLAKVLNKKIADSVKLIGIAGIKELPDDFISIYNDTGIKAAELFDNKLNYVYELAIPLKYLGLAINQHIKFIYQIKLNSGLAANATFIVSGTGRFLVVNEPGKEPMAIPNVPLYNGVAYTTDFWGEYTLANKY